MCASASGSRFNLWYFDKLHAHLQFSSTVVPVADVDQIIACALLLLTSRRSNLTLVSHVSLNETQALVLIIEIETDGRDSFTRWLSALALDRCCAPLSC